MIAASDGGHELHVWVLIAENKILILGYQSLLVSFYLHLAQGLLINEAAEDLVLTRQVEEAIISTLGHDITWQHPEVLDC